MKEVLDAINSNVFPTFVALAVCEMIKSLFDVVYRHETPNVSAKW